MQKLQLSIPEPCHENWQNMTPTDQGRYCNSCAKPVVDFSMMSDYEVLNYFSTRTDEKVCGRALPTQLDRDMTMPRDPKKRRFWYWNYIAMFFMFFSKSNHVKAQQGKLKPITQTVTRRLCNITEANFVRPLPRWISGQITDNHGKPIPFASIKINTSQALFKADKDGFYAVKATTWDQLLFCADDFESATLGADLAADNKNVINVTLMPDYRLKGEISVNTFDMKRTSAGLQCTAIKPGEEKKIKTDTLQPGVIMGGIGRVISIKQHQPLLVVDGVQKPNTNVNTVDPNNIDHVFTLKPAEATALYGNKASAGAVVVVTKKKKNDELKVVKDSLTKKILQKLGVVGTNTINLYPNPVRSGHTFVVSLNFQQTGDMHLNVTDISGRIMLQKQITTSSKDHLEKIETDDRWPAGVYFLTVYNNNAGHQGKLISKVSFVVQ